MRLRQIIKDDQWRDNPPNLEWRPEQGPYQTVSVTAERRDAKSLLALYRRLIAVRRRLPVLAVGDYRGLQGEGDLLAYLREHQGQRVAIVLNLGIESLRFELPGSGQVLLSTNLHREAEPVKRLLDLRPNEGLVVELD
jgi:alpha-glucosidase